LESIKYYKKRIEAGGWAEEVYYSYYSIGLCYKDLKRNNKAIQYFVKGYEFRPTRAECIYEISKIYRESGNNNSSMIFVNLGVTIPYPKEDSLFINKDVYDYLFYYEMSICAYYTKDKSKGVVATKLLLKKDLPKDVTDMIKSNAKFYGLS